MRTDSLLSRLTPPSKPVTSRRCCNPCQRTSRGSLPEIENVPFAGKRQGRGAVGEFFSTLASLQDARSFEEREFIAQGDKVVVLGHYVWQVKANGRTIEGDFAHVFTVRGGQIVAFHEYMDSAAVAKAYR
jgi:uncharacterized protein